MTPDAAQVDMDEGQKLARLALEFPELSAAECGAALQAQAGNLAAAVAILDMHVSAVRTCGVKWQDLLGDHHLACLVSQLSDHAAAESVCCWMGA